MLGFGLLIFYKNKMLYLHLVTCEAFNTLEYVYDLCILKIY